MTVDVSIEVLIGASLFVGGQLVTLAGVVRSNRDQGRRIGALEGREKEREGEAKGEAKALRRLRVRTAAGGVPISDDDQ